MSFLICNVITGQCTVRAPTVDLIEREFYRVDAYNKPRGPEQAICEVPDAYGVTLENYRSFPRSMIFAKFLQRKSE